MSTVALSGLLKSSLISACSTQASVEVTFYGHRDNDPPPNATVYSCETKTCVARGAGTYSDPLTFASASGEFFSYEVILVPYLKK